MGTSGAGLASRPLDSGGWRRGERIVVAVLAFVLWLASIIALGNTAPRGAVPGSDICRASATTGKAQE